jgi:2-C-methyl-D-erythritol 4-phosphate cytidylyltransferase
MASIHAIVPAAGSGARFGATLPKQYLDLSGRPVLYHTLAVLCGCEAIDRVWVVLSPADAEWQRHDWSGLGPKLDSVFCGGASRAESVLNGLAAAQTAMVDDDWALVHDAARPCLAAADLRQLINELADDPVGGLLAVPVADTLKRGGQVTPADEPGHRRGEAAARVMETVPREGLWQAQTPQMFRAGLLTRALRDFPGVTDEAGAVESLGLRPKLVRGRNANFKVTYPEDLAMAAMVLRAAAAS